METIVEKLKAIRVKILKKESNLPISTAFIGYLVSEIENVGKNKGNRVTTEDEAVVVLKKKLAQVDEALAATNYSTDLLDQQAFIKLMLPNMVSNEEVADFVNNCVFEGMSKGDTMKMIGQRWGALVNRAEAAKVYDKLTSAA